MSRQQVGFVVKTLFNFLTGFYEQRLEDKLHVSSDLRTPEAAEFLRHTTQIELLMNAALAACGRELHDIGRKAVQLLQQGMSLHKWHEHVSLWPSAFSGIQVIVNRVTPSHRDSGAAASMYDLLVSAGTHQSATLRLGDVSANLSYKPGTVVLVCGRVLRHEVANWRQGERICMAHFMRDNVHQRLGFHRPPWVDIEDYRISMELGFRERQSI